MMLSKNALIVHFSVLGLLKMTAANPFPMNPDHHHSYFEHPDEDFWGTPFQISSSSPQAPIQHPLSPGSSYPFDVHELNPFWNSQAEEHQSSFLHHYPSHHLATLHLNELDNAHLYQELVLGSDQARQGQFEGIHLEQNTNFVPAHESMQHNIERQRSKGRDKSKQSSETSNHHPSEKQKSYRSRKGRPASSFGRCEKLSEYQWQMSMTDEKVLELYRKIGSSWPPATQLTNRANLDRLNAFLERDFEMAHRILANNKEAIELAQKFSRPSLIKSRPVHKAVESIEEMIACLCRPYSSQHFGTSVRPQWAPTRLTFDGQQLLVKRLHLAWMTDKARVKLLLGILGPNIVDKLIDRLLSEIPEDFAAAADELTHLLDEDQAQRKEATKERVKENRLKERQDAARLRENASSEGQHYQSQNALHDRQFDEHGQHVSSYSEAHSQYSTMQDHHQQGRRQARQDQARHMEQQSSAFFPSSSTTGSW